MSDFTAIRGITETLSSLIETATGMSVEADSSPADDIATDPGVINLYLYRVEYNPFFINQESIATTATQRTQAPLGVNLHYLITPYIANQLDIQTTLGQILKLFHEQPIVSPSDLHPSVADTTEEVRVVHHPLPLEQLIDLWRSFESVSYRLSLTYEVSVVLLDSDVTSTVYPVEQRHVNVRTL